MISTGVHPSCVQTEVAFDPLYPVLQEYVATDPMNVDVKIKRELSTSDGNPQFSTETEMLLQFLETSF